MSPDLGDMSKYGCPKSPDWGSDIDVWTEGEEFSEDVTRNLRQVLGRTFVGKECGPFWSPFWSPGMPQKCQRRPADGMSPVDMCHTASSFFFS